jgi:hypothetical protein
MLTGHSGTIGTLSTPVKKGVAGLRERQRLPSWRSKHDTHTAVLKLIGDHRFFMTGSLG